MRDKWKIVLSAGVFCFCVASTIISYHPYTYQWDDSDYLVRSIVASRAVWSGSMHQLRDALVSVHPPVMMLLGVPWGPVGSWSAAGKCFVSLNALTSFFAALCLYMLLRSGIKPSLLAIASVCLYAALGPYPAGSEAHTAATAFMADSLFAWIAFAAVLLISYEGMTENFTIASSLVRGAFWALIFSVGAITKISFFYFILLVVPILFLLRMRRGGLRNAVLAVVSLGIFSLPVCLFWLLYGLTSLKNGWAASFGHDAPLYYASLAQFVSETVHQSPGSLLFGVFVTAGIAYLIVKRREITWGANVLALLVLAGYCVIGLASKNREIRYLYVGVIAPPFLIAALISGKAFALPQRSARIVSILGFCGLFIAGLPMLHRTNRHSLDRADAVLAQAVQFKAKHILMATDSPTLNENLMRVSIAVSPSWSVISTENLAWRAAYGATMEDDFSSIRAADLVVFQKREELYPPFTNTRVSEYEQYTRNHSINGPIQAMEDVSVYRVDHEN